MVKSVCVVSECGGWVASKGLCPKHHGLEVGSDGRVCTILDCKRGEYGKRGWCKKHYNAARKQGRTGSNLQCGAAECRRVATAKGYCDSHRRAQLKEKPEIVCRFEGCKKLSESRGLCNGHYKQWGKGSELQELKRFSIPRGTWGGWYMSGGGYVERHRLTEDGVREYQKQHRYVVELREGRKLKPHENVHHLNGQRSDNRPENLELWSKSQPSGQRVEDKTAWALEWLEQYAPERLVPDMLD